MKPKKGAPIIKYPEAKKQLGDNLRKLRLKNNLTQENMEDKFGIDVRVYQKFESGRHNPTLETLILLSKCFKVSIHEILKDVD